MQTRLGSDTNAGSREATGGGVESAKGAARPPVLRKTGVPVWLAAENRRGGDRRARGRLNAQRHRQEDSGCLSGKGDGSSGRKLP